MSRVSISRRASAGYRRLGILQRLGAAAIPLLAASGIASAEAPVKVDVVLSGINSAKGNLEVLVYDREGWLKTPLQTVRAANSGDANQTVTLTLVAGEYAFSAYQDENENGELDMTLVFPAEPAGFSNGHRPRFGPPRYKKAKLSVSADSKPVDIELR